MFDVSNSFPHFLLNGKAKVRNWKDLVKKLNDTFLSTSTSTNSASNYKYPAIHIHNEEKIGDLLLLIVEVWKERNKIRYPRPEAPVFIEKSQFQEIVNLSPYKLVFTNTIDENWGFLSTQVNTRTTKWINMTNHLRIHYSSYQTIKDFLDSDQVILLFNFFVFWILLFCDFIIFSYFLFLFCICVFFPFFRLFSFRLIIDLAFDCKYSC
jgi:hypothetical protein